MRCCLAGLETEVLLLSGSPALTGGFLVAYGSVTSLLQVLWSSCPSQQGGCQGLAGDLADDSCRVILVMAAKRQKLSWKQYRILIVHCGRVSMAPDKEGTSGLQNRNTLDPFP